MSNFNHMLYRGHYEICEACDGTGESNVIDTKEHTFKKCKCCDGTGKVYVFEPKYRVKVLGKATEEKVERVKEIQDKMEKLYFELLHYQSDAYEEEIRECEQ